jgi:cbb3-type cytochrome oxidase maturation protein
MLELTLAQFAVSLCMGLAALCIFIWAVLSGMFRNVEDVAVRVYRAEVGDDEQR